MKPSRAGRILAAFTTAAALLLSTGSAALAATDSLTLTALNRSGAKVNIWATVVDAASAVRYKVRTGKAKKLPKGTYVVLAQIDTGDTTTLGGKAVKVSGATKLTIDARRGRRVGLAVSPAPTGAFAQMSARVCSRTDPDADVEATGDQLYVIPTTSKKVAFAALGSWRDDADASDSFAVLNQTVGVPSRPTRTYQRSALGTVTVDSRRGPGGANFSDVAVQPVRKGCALEMYAELVSSDVPTISRIHLSPTSWDIRSDEVASANKTGDSLDIGGYMTTRTVAAGKSYNVRFYAAAWGPGRLLPYISDGRISFDMNDGFEDPGYFDGWGSVEGGEKATATLQFKGRTVKTVKDTGWMPDETYLSYGVKKAGWYTLRNVSSRYYPEITYPAGMLSTRSIATYRFRAKPRTTMLAPVYALQMIPAALNRYNQAQPHSTTTVAFKLTREPASDITSGKKPTVRSLTASMSTDDGRTWESVKVRKIKGVWTAAVGNPSGGAVSLRARATYTSGGYTEVAIVRAYGIG